MRRSLEDQLLWEVQQGHTDSNGKKLPSGLRLLEKFAWISNVVRASDWLLIEAIKRIPVDKAAGRSKEWAKMQCVS